MVDPWALHCLFILLGDLMLDVKRSPSDLAEGSLNAFLRLSLFTLALCIFQVGKWEFLFFSYWFWLFGRQVFKSTFDSFWWTDWRSMILLF